MLTDKSNDCKEFWLFDKTERFLGVRTWQRAALKFGKIKDIDRRATFSWVKYFTEESDWCDRV